MKLNKKTEISRLNLIVFLGVTVSVIIFLTGQAQGSDQIKRDPLVPLVSKGGTILIPREVDITGLSLKGIIYSQDKPVAIINDQVLEVESVIGEYKVCEIKEKEVVLKKDGQIFKLRLEEE